MLLLQLLLVGSGWLSAETGEGEARQDIRSTLPSGDFEFESIPEGVYDIQFIKSGYRMSVMKSLERRSRAMRSG